MVYTINSPLRFDGDGFPFDSLSFVVVEDSVVSNRDVTLQLKQTKVTDNWFVLLTVVVIEISHHLTSYTKQMVFISRERCTETDFYLIFNQYWIYTNQKDVLW